MSDVTIDHRFRGPAESGNGGYTCALVATEIDGPAEVMLRVPPPLDRPLTAERDAEGAELLDGETVVAVARPATLSGTVPEPVSLEQAELASTRYSWIDDHPYPGCFVCGPDREVGDGLRIFPGPVEGRDIHACPWTPAAEFDDGDGNVRPEFVWAALDCPSGIVTDRFGDVGTSILGRLAVELLEPVPVEESYVLIAWTESSEGRKLDTGSALFSADGRLLAHARARWIVVREG